MSSSKTPLFSRLRNLVALASSTERVPVDERIEQHHQAELTRRQFLAGTGLVAGASLFGALPATALAPLRKEKEAPHIAIIGAGIAGLTAAWTLRKRGVYAEVYEATTRIGGRMFTGRNVVGDNVYSELGGEFVDTTHTEILALAKELGISLNDLQSETEKPYTDLFVFKGQQYSEKDIVTSLQAYVPALTAVKEKVRTQPEARKQYDSISAAKFLEQLGVSGWLYALFDTAYTTEMGLDIGELSSLQILDLLPTAQSAEDLRFFNDSDERLKIQGGSDALTTALAEKLGNAIKVHHLWYDVQPFSNRYKLTFDTAQASKEILADFVICTTPFTVLRQMRTIKLLQEIPPMQQKAINELSYGTNSKLILGMKSAFWRKLGLSGTCYTDPDLQLVWDSSRMQNTTEAALTMLYGGEQGRLLNNDYDEYHAKAALPKLDMLFKGAQEHYNGRAKQFTWPSYRYSFGSYSCYSVGQQTTIGGYEGAPVGNFYFAGEHCSKKYQGFMNGAAETGRLAALDILRKMGK
ncbi:MAG: FAD-dependent oxidoreductase [Bacteriodetes bacterium]|nr:FAD-dependent oxidoreductase [Bacteroidota bacterium]